jgi:hypothetical protein
MDTQLPEPPTGSDQGSGASRTSLPVLGVGSATQLDAGTIAHIEELHAELVEAESQLSRGIGRSLARRRLARARVAEETFLQELGFSSYTDYRVRVQLPSPNRPDDDSTKGTEHVNDPFAYETPIDVEPGPATPAEEVRGDPRGDHGDQAASATAWVAPEGPPQTSPGEATSTVNDWNPPEAPPHHQPRPERPFDGGETWAQGGWDAPEPPRVDDSSHSGPTLSGWSPSEPSGPSQTDVLLSGLRAQATEFVDAHVRVAEAEAARILRVAESRAAELVESAEGTREKVAAAARAVSAGLDERLAALESQLNGLSGLLGDLPVQVGLARRELRSSVESLPGPSSVTSTGGPRSSEGPEPENLPGYAPRPQSFADW